MLVIKKLFEIKNSKISFKKVEFKVHEFQTSYHGIKFETTVNCRCQLLQLLDFRNVSFFLVQTRLLKSNYLPRKIGKKILPSFWFLTVEI